VRESRSAATGNNWDRREQLAFANEIGQKCFGNDPVPKAAWMQVNSLRIATCLLLQIVLHVSVTGYLLHSYSYSYLLLRCADFVGVMWGLTQVLVVPVVPVTSTVTTGSTALLLLIHTFGDEVDELSVQAERSCNW
jgi:hypothetical protein